MDNWHTLKTENLIQELGTDLAKGLTAEDVALRTEKYEPNELVERGTTSPLEDPLGAAHRHHGRDPHHLRRYFSHPRRVH